MYDICSFHCKYDPVDVQIFTPYFFPRFPRFQVPNACGPSMPFLSQLMEMGYTHCFIAQVPCGQSSNNID